MRLGFVQVEVSTRCQLNCLMCPKRHFEWLAKDMDIETFARIPFRKFRYAHLQGWGEPLLNPRIDEMIEIAGRRCKVSMTTNGLLIDRHVESICELETLAVSIASGDAALHRSVRGCELDRLKENIRLVSELRSKKPKIVIATMMLRSTIPSLPKIVEFAADCGADEVVVNNLDYVPAKELADEVVFGWEPEAEAEKVLHEAYNLASQLGVKFAAKPLVMEEALVCAENPVENCFVTVDGMFAPCAYLHLPIRGKIVRYFGGKRFEIPKVYFESFEKWKGSELREVFRRRMQAAYQSLPTEIPPLPEFCRTCYKAWSV
ncbi:MAG: radical SAM protein [Archaeoglobaceae archaeon]